ncbi:S8 family serine peptidase [Candidatus Woesearchaeota archaeon]|jgi:hypothetical protein|nr:S8 family serine peptidase [Candidatus Woesearchaeota archaeon]MBT4387703.1 S8 family serine peptidase [Candidatus Woesearchaeota archaeon]MBT4595935.1 S8 family serine peptidase [Candidatus Woesearchaeota archaeon]MBT5741065.1 S8 family serine peptidase [Candidatus Woesearchaeota archaeon]MBT7849795.1 S8 family serine peptidase [Candidatus Woesearchaeota archaeon]
MNSFEKSIYVVIMLIVISTICFSLFIILNHNSNLNKILKTNNLKQNDNLENVKELLNISIDNNFSNLINSANQRFSNIKQERELIDKKIKEIELNKSKRLELIKKIRLESKIRDEVKRQTKEKEKINIIIDLDNENEKDNLIEKLNEQNIQINNDLGNAIAVTIDSNKINNISENDQIKNIHLDREYSILSFEQFDKFNISNIRESNNISGDNIKVAIIDTGIDESVFNNIISKSFVSNNVNDNIGHGTQIASIIKNIAPDSILYNAKVVTDNGLTSTSSIIQGIKWAINNSVDIISLSLGSKFHETDQLLNEELQNAIDNDIIVVVASGNCGPCSNVCGDFKGVTNPADYESVISVGAVDINNNYACFSSGQEYENYIKPDLTALGVNINVTSINNKNKIVNGTSFSAPMISGLIALKLEQEELNHNQIKRLLEYNAIDLGQSGKDIEYGSGVIDIDKLFKINSVIIDPIIIDDNDTSNESNIESNEIKINDIIINTNDKLILNDIGEFKFNNAEDDYVVYDNNGNTAIVEIREFNSSEDLIKYLKLGFNFTIDDYENETIDSFNYYDNILWFKNSSVYILSKPINSKANLTIIRDEYIKKIGSDIQNLIQNNNNNNKPNRNYELSSTPDYDGEINIGDTRYVSLNGGSTFKYKLTTNYNGIILFSLTDVGRYEDFDITLLDYEDEFMQESNAGSGEDELIIQNKETDDVWDLYIVVSNFKDDPGDVTFKVSTGCTPSSSYSCSGNIVYKKTIDGSCEEDNDIFLNCNYEKKISYGDLYCSNNDVHQTKSYTTGECKVTSSNGYCKDVDKTTNRKVEDCGSGTCSNGACYECQNNNDCSSGEYCDNSNKCQTYEYGHKKNPIIFDWKASRSVNLESGNVEWYKTSTPNGGKLIFSIYSVQGDENFGLSVYDENGNNLLGSNSTGKGKDQHVNIIKPNTNLETFMIKVESYTGRSVSLTAGDIKCEEKDLTYCDSYSNKVYLETINPLCGSNVQLVFDCNNEFDIIEDGKEYYCGIDNNLDVIFSKDYYQEGYCTNSDLSQCFYEKKYRPVIESVKGGQKYCTLAEGLCTCKENEGICKENSQCEGNLECESGNCKSNCIDSDNDGHYSNCSPIDCDDNDPERNAGLAEVCDGKDNNCNGNVDETFDLISDPNNCGGCNIKCTDQQVCSNSQCKNNYECGDGVCTIDVETSSTCSQDCYADFKVLNIKNVNPSIATENSQVSITAEVINNGTYYGSSFIEAGISPRSWNSYFLNSFNLFSYELQSYIDNPNPVCPNNDYYDSKAVELDSKETEEITFNLISQTKQSVDSCDINSRSAWSDTFDIVVGFYENLNGGAYTHFKLEENYNIDECSFPYGNSEYCSCENNKFSCGDGYTCNQGTCELCTNPDGSSSDCSCRVDNDCQEGYECDTSSRYGVCNEIDVVNECAVKDNYECKNGDVYLCEDTPYGRKLKISDYCVDRELCPINVAEVNRCITNDDYNLIIEYASSGVKVFKQYRDILTIRLNLKENVGYELEYDDSVFESLTSDCTNNNFKIGLNICKFEIVGFGDHVFKYGQDIEPIEIILNPTNIYVTNIKKLHQRYDDQESVAVLLEKTYQQANLNNGIVYDLEDYIIDVPHTFNYNFLNYNEPLACVLE